MVKIELIGHYYASSYSIDPSHKRLDDNVAKEHIPLMRAPWPMTGEVNRRNVINPYLEKLQGLLEQASPRLLNVKLFIYGFSRGAAEARTFVSLPAGATGDAGRVSCQY